MKEEEEVKFPVDHIFPSPIDPDNNKILDVSYFKYKYITFLFNN